MMPGWSACGCIMDFIQRCYRSSMRPFPDRPDVLVPGRWYWCPDGAKAVPFPSTFFSLANVNRPDWDKGIGEVLFSNVPVRGVQLAGFLGQNVCGSADVWRNGAPYSALGTPTVDQWGVPVCCQPSGEAGRGGLSIGGKSVESYLCVDTSQGGLSVGGYGLEVSFRAERAQGGLRIGGTVQDAWQAKETGQGGLRAGGYGIEVGFAAEIGQGGLKLGGSGIETGFPAETGQGGLSIGGYGLEVGFRAERAQGGLRVGGSVRDGFAASEKGQGGLSIGGYGREVGFLAERAQGGLRIGGKVQDAWTAKETSQGGLKLGGMVQDNPAFTETAKGGLSVGGEGTGEVAGISVSCGGCTTAPRNWSLTVSGYTGSAASLNGTWTMLYQSGCNWLVMSGGVTWALQLSGSTWQLSGATGAVQTQFTHSTTGWNCTAANTLPYASGTGDTGHPASVTISPA